MSDESPTVIAIRAVKAQGLREAADAWLGNDDPPYPMSDPVYRFLQERADWLEKRP